MLEQDAFMQFGEGDLVRVVWRDAQVSDSWTYPNDIDDEAPTVTAAGHFIKVSKDALIVAGYYTEEGGEVNAIMTIPTETVVSIHRLRIEGFPHKEDLSPVERARPSDMEPTEVLGRVVYKRQSPQTEAPANDRDFGYNDE